MTDERRGMDEDTEDALCDAVDAVLQADSHSERLAAIYWLSDLTDVLRTLTEDDWTAEHSEIDGGTANDR